VGTAGPVHGGDTDSVPVAALTGVADAQPRHRTGAGSCGKAGGERPFPPLKQIETRVLRAQAFADAVVAVDGLLGALEEAGS
jgi:hypothetical protein